MWRTVRLPKDWERVIRPAVLARDGRCMVGYAGVCRGAAEEVDHVVPASRGGTDAWSNLQAACGPCHRRKTALESRGGRRARSRERHPGIVEGGAPGGGG